MSPDPTDRPPRPASRVLEFLCADGGYQPPEWVLLLQMAVTCLVAFLCLLPEAMGPTALLKEILPSATTYSPAGISETVTWVRRGLLVLGLLCAGLSAVALLAAGVNRRRRSHDEEELEQLIASPQSVERLIAAVEHQRVGVRWRAAEAPDRLGWKSPPG